MPGPPEDVSASDLFQQLLKRPRPSELVEFSALDKPGKKGQIRIQVLAKDDHDRARFAAHALLKKTAAKYGLPNLTPEDMASDAIGGVASDLSACEVLALACLSPDPMPGHTEDDEHVRYRRIFADGEAVGKTLTPDEVLYLFSAYNMTQFKYGPHEAVCLPEDINAWVRRLVEGAAQNPFLRLSSAQWAQMLTAMARRLYDLSVLLESQWQSLPESLRSDLATYCLGISSSGEPAESFSDPVLPGARGEVTFEQALRLANKIKPSVEE